MKVSILVPALAMAFLLMAGGCTSAEGDSSPADPSASHASMQATASGQPSRVEIVTDSGTFWFVPTSCSIYIEEGLDAYSIGGAGEAGDGQPVYVTIVDEDQDPETGADLRISVGVDTKFKTGDPEWISNDAMSHAMGVPGSQATVDGQTLAVTGAVFGKDYGGQLVATAPISVDCRR